MIMRIVVMRITIVRLIKIVLILILSIKTQNEFADKKHSENADTSTSVTFDM